MTTIGSTSGEIPFADETDDDEGCPKGDPSCTSRSDECHDACERDLSVPLKGYEGLAVAVRNALHAIEEALTAHYDAAGEDTTTRDALIEARRRFVSVLVAFVAPVDDDNDDPTCDACGEANADECVPCLVWRETGAVDELMLCEDCITTGRRTCGRVIRTDIVRVSAIPARWQVEWQREGETVRILGLSGQSDAARGITLDDALHPVRYWPYGADALRKLNAALGTSFDLSEFTHA